ncbi:response regulator [Clostridium sp. MB40-C1]|uniref:response regulator n=1 Tax=Clostridium sp. MB40-C1 TaxID=3070996 RepID=UPI0027DEACE6|nr:response regulator [Clostridium sp. MB40-C1]WMJ81133.1 response regulator [Clostridium sp. MB40-C1]
MENIKVVIVDDSPFSISILRDVLTEKGFEVIGDASSLEETIEVVKTTKPDLVTMDMTIPGTDGLECTRAIHSIDPNIKVVVVSSMMDDEIVKKAKQNRVSGYIQKPVDPDELTTVIQRIMSGEELFKELEAIYFDIFKEAFLDNMNRMTKTVPNFSQETGLKDTQESKGVSIVVGIIGRHCGSMIIDLSYETVDSLAKHILKRELKNREEGLAMMAEFANIIAGNACSLLNRKNKAFGLRVAPPAVFHGSSLNISKTIIQSKSVVAETIFGEISIDAGFTRGDSEWM